ncbi:MAG: biotin--[acetyl-CoA-carboxylase] ligase [Cyanobium sp.]
MIGRITAERRRLLGPAAWPPQAGAEPPPSLASPWRLRGLAVCASTETELDHWLAELLPLGSGALRRPLALLAQHQRFGHGQQGRVWLAPRGGVWLSAALPWPSDPIEAAAPGLAVAVGLALQLEQLGLPVRLKWPNDLLLEGPDGQLAKLAGLLPRLRLRGERIRWARLGVGLNGLNPVPAGATNLRRHLGCWGADPSRLAARVLLALEWAMAASGRPEQVRQLAEQRLHLAAASLRLDGEDWRPLGLERDGGLRLQCGRRQRVLQRRFDPALQGAAP